MNRSNSTLYSQPSNVNDESGVVTTNFYEENGNPAINPCMATEALTIIAFECLENFIDLEQKHAFTSHLSNIFETMNMPSFKPLILGFPGFLELANFEADSVSRSNIFDELIITELSLPLNDTLKDRVCNALSKNEGILSAKKVMQNLMRNRSLISKVNSEDDSDSTSLFFNKLATRQDDIMETTEAKFIFSLILRSFEGN